MPLTHLGVRRYGLSSQLSLESTNLPNLASVLDAAAPPGISLLRLPLVNSTELVAGVLYNVLFRGIRNPRFSGTAGEFSVVIRDSEGTAAHFGNFSSLQHIGPGLAQPATVTVDPDTAGADTMFTLDVVLANGLEAGGTITLYVPSDFAGGGEVEMSTAVPPGAAARAPTP